MVRGKKKLEYIRLEIYPEDAADVETVASFRKAVITLGTSESVVLPELMRGYMAQHAETLDSGKLFSAKEVRGLISEHFGLAINREHLWYFRKQMTLGADYFQGSGGKSRYTYNLRSIWPRIVAWAEGKGVEVPDEVRNLPNKLCGTRRKPKPIRIPKTAEPVASETVTAIGGVAEQGWDVSQFDKK